MDSRLLTDLCQKLMLASQTTSELALNLLKNNQEIALALSRMLMNHAEEASSQQAPASQTSPAIPTAILNHLSSPPENLAKVPLNFLAFFAERGLLLKDCTICNSGNPISFKDYKLSKQIWEHYHLLGDFCKKYCCCKTFEFNYDLSNLSNDEKNIIRMFCRNLQELKALGLSEENNILHLTRPPKGHKISLLNGEWGECAVLYILRKALQEQNTKRVPDSPHIRYQFFKNLKFSDSDNPDKTTMELDVVLLYNKTDLFIFESKCGQVLAVDKWVDRTRLFEKSSPVYSIPETLLGNLPRIRGHFITCTPRNEIPEQYFAPFHLMHFSTLQEDFLKLLAQVEKRQQASEPADNAPRPSVPPAQASESDRI